MGARNDRRFLIRNRTRGTLVAADVQLADSPRARRVGLLKHSELAPDQGMWIYPTQAIHTFWMRFPIDVIFLDSRKRVKRVYHRLPPFRLTRFVWGAASAVELSADAARGSRTEIGDELEFSPCGD